MARQVTDSRATRATPADRVLLAGAAVLLVVLVASGVQPYDRGTWLLEVFPVIVVVPLLAFTRGRYPLTTLLYAGVFLHAIVLIVGGHYTYARVPLGFQLQDWFDLARNPYDRIGHFFQGFVPALAAREILARGRYVNGARMGVFLVICVVLAISATYELVEWAAALLFGDGAVEFLGTQGDPWDTQSDMFLALIGAATALVFLSSLHDGQIRSLQETEANDG